MKMKILGTLLVSTIAFAGGEKSLEKAKAYKPISLSLFTSGADDAKRIAKEVVSENLSENASRELIESSKSILRYKHRVYFGNWGESIECDCLDKKDSECCLRSAEHYLRNRVWCARSETSSMEESDAYRRMAKGFLGLAVRYGNSSK